MKQNTLLGYALALVTLSSPSHAHFLNGVASGDISQTTAVIWAHNTQKIPDGSIPVTFKYGTDPSFANVTGIQTIEQPSYLEPAKLKLTGLQSNTTYYYRAEDAKGRFLDGQFKTLPDGAAQPGLRFGVLDDVRQGYSVFPTNLRSPAKDFILSSGSFSATGSFNEQAYATTVNLPGLQTDLHNALKNTDGVRNTLVGLRRSTALYNNFSALDMAVRPATTAGGAAPSDDPDNFDQTGNYINETKRYTEGVLAFQQYTPMESLSYGATGDPRTANKTKLYRRINYGKTATVIMVDSLSFRDKAVAAPTNPTDPAQVQQFLIDAYASGRTLLGAQQLADLKADLLAAQQNGIKWKFVQGTPMLQNVGPLGDGQTRYEGYAAERNDLLAFIDSHAIKNVVFISNGYKGLWVNDLNYQDTLGGPQKPLASFDINVGPVTTYRQFTDSLQRPYTDGNFYLELGIAAGLVSAPQAAFYDSLPTAPDTDSNLNDKDDFIKFALNNSVLAPLGYNPLGLQGSTLNATLLKGDYAQYQKNTWAVFDINPTNLALTVTVYGADSIATLALTDPQAAKQLPISIVSQFRVVPK